MLRRVHDVVKNQHALVPIAQPSERRLRALRGAARARRPSPKKVAPLQSLAGALAQITVSERDLGSEETPKVTLSSTTASRGKTQGQELQEIEGRRSDAMFRERDQVIQFEPV